ncbi:MAG: putative toxin-antitoxin system toxin component, PIN family [Terriglobales bacterium]
MRAVIDVSVFTSALMSSSTVASPRQIVKSIQAGRIKAIISPELLKELAGTLSLPKIRKRVSEPTAEAFLASLTHYADMVPDVANPVAKTRDIDDDYLVALAESANAALVSTDKDILEAGLEPPALTPRELVLQLGQYSSRSATRSRMNWLTNINGLDKDLPALALPSLRKPTELIEHRKPPRVLVRPPPSTFEPRPRSLTSFLKQ